jgi:hypothetical protein
VIKINVRCVGHVGYTQEMNNAYTIVVSLKGRVHMRDLGINEKIVLDHVLEKHVVV